MIKSKTRLRVARVAAGTVFARQSNLDIRTGETIPPDDRRMIYQKANMLWHSDSSFKPVPSLCSLLSGRIVPPEGGNTEFASARAAYPSLPEATKRRIENLIVIHDYSWSRDQVRPGFFTAEERAVYPPVRHPLVRTNPANGRKSLFLGAHASHIVGMSVAEGRALLKELLEKDFKGIQVLPIDAALHRLSRPRAAGEPQGGQRLEEARIPQAPPLSEPASRTTQVPFGAKVIRACSFDTIRSSTWMLLSGWRPSVLNAVRGYSIAFSPNRMSLPDIASRWSRALIVGRVAREINLCRSERRPHAGAREGGGPTTGFARCGGGPDAALHQDLVVTREASHGSTG